MSRATLARIAALLAIAAFFALGFAWSAADPDHNAPPAMGGR